MKKLWLITALVLAGLTLATGGTDSADINRMIFVAGIGIDRDGEDYRCTFYTAVPTGSDSAVGDNNVEYKPVTVTADSIARALRRLEMNSSRSISLEHLNCCAIGASAADDDLPALLDYLLRAPDVRRQCSLLALDCSAEDFFGISYSGSIASGTASLLEQQDDSLSRGSLMTLGRLGSVTENGSGYCLYILDIASDKEGASSTEANTASDKGSASSSEADTASDKGSASSSEADTASDKGSASSSEADTASAIELRGLAVYSADGLTGRLTAQQAELARLFTDGQSSGVIASADEYGEQYLYEIRSSVCRKDFQPGIPPVGSFRIELDCVPVESEGGSDSFPTDEELSRSLYDQLNDLLSLSRSCGSAFTGLEAEARQSERWWYEQHSKSWEDIYRTALLELDVKCRTADGNE